MIDNEIIKALEKVKGHQIVTGNVCVETNTFDYVTVAQLIEIYNRQQAQLADERAKIEICAETISRQDAEIERLKKKHRLNLLEQLDIAEQIKAEAIKDVESRLIEKFKRLEHAPRTNRKTLRIEEVNAIVNTVLQVSVPNIINQVVKEMGDK